DWGAERVREVLQKEFLGRDLPDGPPPPPSAIALRDHVGVHQQRDGRAFVGFSLRAGRISGHQLRLVADLAERHGSSSVRLTPQQKMVIVDVEPATTGQLVADLEGLDLPARPGAFRKGMMACTGIEFCKLAIGETK